MAQQPFPLIVVAGTPYERGYQHGSQAREQVARCVDVHRRAIQYFSGLDWPMATARAGNYLPDLQEYAPALVEELRGIADGAGQPFADILTLNLRYELTFTPSMVGGCTSFAVLPDATANGHTYVGQGWDNLAALGDACIILRAEQDGRPLYITFTEAGVPAMVGLNAAGIGIARNALIMEGGGRESGVCINAVHYRVLSALNMSDALVAVFSPRLISPLHYMIAAVGDAISLEATPVGVDHILETNGILTHANHFTSTRLPVKDLIKGVMPDTLFRDQRLRRYLEEHRGHIDVPLIYEGLRDHFNYPDSICRHPDERDGPVALFESVATVVMDLDDRVLYVTDGPPCQHSPRAIHLRQMQRV